MSALATNMAEDLGFRLYHLSPGIGTEVHDIDLSKDLGVDVIDFLSDLLVERKVIFFRDQAISMQQHIAFARLAVPPQSETASTASLHGTCRPQ